MLVCYVFFPGGVGGGDVKLIAMMGAFLGLSAGFDGMSGVEIMGALLDPSPSADRDLPPDPWQAERLPGGLELAARSYGPRDTIRGVTNPATVRSDYSRASRFDLESHARSYGPSR